MVLQLRRAKTDWSGCCQMAVQGTLWLAKRYPSTWFCYFSYQVATQLSSRGRVDPIPDPILSQKFLGYSQESNLGPLGWQSDVLTTIPNRQSNMGNACYYSLEKTVSSCLLSKKLKVSTYKTIILPVVWCGCETWSLTLREEHRLRVFENKYLGRYLGLRKTKLQENGESYIMLSYMHCILRLTYLGVLNQGDWDGQDT